MRVAYLASRKNANGIYRAIAPMVALGATGRHHVQLLEDQDRRCPPGIDVLHVHRFCEARAQAIAREAKVRGAAVVWDNDDDQGAMPKSVVTHKHFSGYSWQRRRIDFQRMFGFADLVTTPSTVLADRLRELGAPRTEVIENFIIDEMLTPDRAPRSGVTIGWIAGLEHQMDVEQLPIRAVLQRLLDERQDVNVVTIGLGLGLRGERYRAVSGVPFRSLLQAAGGFDIAIAPLADLDFGRARSNIKLKEYAGAGVPWLASPVGPYAEMGERQGGRLVADDRWHEELSRLIDKPRERRKLGQRAAKWARGELLSANVHCWERAFGAAVQHAQASVAAHGT